MPGYYKRRKELLSLITSYEDCHIDVTKQEYLTITEGFMSFIGRKLLEGEEIILPVAMGKLEIQGRKQQIRVEDDKIKGLAPDWKSTIELWNRDPEAKENKKMIYFFNEHSKGVRYKIKWTKTKIPLIFKSVLTFKAVRPIKRGVSKNVNEGKEYIILNN